MRHFMTSGLSALVLAVVLAATVLHTSAQPTMPANPINDPDLPNYVAPLVNMAAGSIIIPFGTLQGTYDRNGTHLFNFPAYGLVAHLLWRDIPLRFALRGGKTNATQIDFSVSTLRLWPRTPAAQLTTAQVRDFDGGAFIVPANFARFAWVHILDYVNGSARQERLQYCETNTVVVFNASADFQIPLRYNLTTKPFISVMDSSSFAFVQVLYLRWAGFVFGQHYKQMNYAEANSINGNTCVSYISEPHFRPGSSEAVNFQTGMRQFVEAGGNFIAQCGGIGTYEQCDRQRDSAVSLTQCPNGFLATNPGGFRLWGYQSFKGRLSGTWRLDREETYASDTLFGQYVGPWTWAYGDIESLNVWSTSGLNTNNNAHWVVGARDTSSSSSSTGGRTYFAAHSKLQKFHGAIGGNVFYLAGHEYTPFDGLLTRFDDYRIASPAGARLWLNGALHPANRTGCRATVTLPDGTIRDVGELTIDPCRYDTSAPECNTVYECSAPKFSGFYREGWNYGVELLADYPLSFTMNVTLPNRVAILSVLDVNGFFVSGNSDTNGGNDNRLTALYRTLPNIYNLLESRFNRVWAGVVHSLEDSPFYNRLIPFVASRSAMTGTAPTNRRGGSTRVLDALLAALNDVQLIWDGSLRVIHLYTNSTAPSAAPSGLIAAMNVFRPAVVIVVARQSLVQGYTSLNLPRTSVISLTFPNYPSPFDASDSLVNAAAATFLPPVVTATDALLQNFGLFEGADPLNVASTVSSATLSLTNQNSADLTLTAVAAQPLNLALTGGYGIPGGPTFSPMPYTLSYAVAGLDSTMRVFIFWSEFASAIPLTATVLENTDVTVPIATRLRLSASATSTKDIFLEILNITKNGGTTDVWATDFAYIRTAENVTAVKGTYYRTDAFTFRTRPNFFGNYTVNYRVYDRCVRSESTIALTINPINLRPTAVNFTYFLVPGDAVTIEWFIPVAKINDRETADTQLRVSFASATVANAGTLQVFNSATNTWSTLVPSTIYPVTTPIRFQSTSLSSVNASILYSVWDADNLNNAVPAYARFEFTAPPNLPPVIAVSPTSNPTLTTAQAATASFRVTVTDFLADLTTELLVEDINVAWNELTQLRPTGSVDTRTYSLFNTQLAGSTLISSIALTNNGINNSRTFDFTWTPSASAPFGATYTFVLVARDPRGLISNKVTVVLRTPANTAPVVQGFLAPSATPTFDESSTLIARNLTIFSTDADAIHTEALNLTILSLPSLGTLYYSDCVTPVAINDVIPFTALTQSGGRTVTPVCYVPNVYTSGTDTITVRATDLANLPSAVRTLNIVINPINFPPVSNNVTRSTNVPITFTVPSSDPDGDALTFTILSVGVPSSLGRLAYNATNVAIAPGQTFAPAPASNQGWAQQFTYTANANVTSHVVNFTYRVTDPSGLNSDIHWAIINYETNYVPPIPPVSRNATFTIPEDTTLTIIFNSNIDPLVTDVDGRPVQIRIIDLPFSTLSGPTGSQLSTNSVFSFAPDGSRLLATYQPPLNFVGTVQFQYLVTDDQGESSNVSYVTINVLPVNDPPTIVAEPPSITVARSQAGTFTVNISDVDSTTVSLVVAAGNTVPQPSTLSATGWTLNGNAEVLVVNLTNPTPGSALTIPVSWLPDISLPDGSSGSFTVFAVDTELLSSSLRPVLTVSVVANDPPTVVPTYTYSFTVAEDFADFNIVLGGTDPQLFHREVLDVIMLALPDANSVRLLQSGTELQLGTINSTGANGETVATVVARSYPNFNGQTTFVFQVRDLLGAVSAQQIVTITVTPVNDPPISNDEILAVPENLCFSSTACPDGQVALALVPSTVLRASDVDSSTLTLTFTSLPANGTLYYKSGTQLTEVTSTFTVTGTSWEFVYEPPANVHSTCVDEKNPTETTCDPYTTASFSVSDGSLSANQQLRLVVLPRNDPPTGEDLVFYINEDEILNIVLPAVDPDDVSADLTTRTTGIAPGSRGDLVTTANVSVPFSGKLATEADKTIVFTPLPDDFSGRNTYYARFFYEVEDRGGLISREYSVTIYVLPVADEITLIGVPEIRINEDTVGSFVLGKESVNWVSKDKGEVFITLTSLPPVGVLTVCVQSECDVVTSSDIGVDLNPLAVFSYTPPPDAFGENFTSFTYTISLRPEGINNLTTISQTFTVHVIPVNDPPRLVPLFALSPLATIFDEDTFEVIGFEATDIDSPLENLTASIVNGLDVGVRMNVYSCIATAEAANGCVNGPLAKLGEDLTPFAPARWSVGLNPLPNANGNTRLAFAVSDGELLSEVVPAPVVVRPINDAPEIIAAEATTTDIGATFAFDARDIDFRFRTVALNFTDLSGLGHFSLGQGELPTEKLADQPCFRPIPSQLRCFVPIHQIPSWLETIFYRFGNESDAQNATVKRQAEEPVTNRSIEIAVDDLGSIDYRPDRPLNATVVLLVAPPGESSLIATTNPPANSVGLIAGTIAGLLGAAVIGALAVFFLRRSAAAKVTDYFDRMALEMEGGVNASPLYQPGAKGGESVLYKGKD